MDKHLLNIVKVNKIDTCIYWGIIGVLKHVRGV